MALVWCPGGAPLSRRLATAMLLPIPAGSAPKLPDGREALPSQVCQAPSELREQGLANGAQLGSVLFKQEPSLCE